MARETIKSSVELLSSVGCSGDDSPRARKSPRLSGKLPASPSGLAKAGARQATANSTRENILKNELRNVNLMNALDSIA